MWKPPKGPEQAGLGHANPHLVHEGPEARNTNCLVSLLENMFELAVAFTVSLSLYCPFVILWSLRLFLSLFFSILHLVTALYLILIFLNLLMVMLSLKVSLW